MSSFGNVVTLKAGQSDLSVQVIEKGLHVFSISFNDKNGKKQEIIIGPEDPKDQVKDRRFLHSIVGRYCNRLPDTPITLPNGQSFTPQQNGGAGTSLHGGPSSAGWDQKTFTNVSSSPSEALFSPAERKYLAGLVEQGQAGVWEYVSPHGEGGHLGKVRTQTAFVVEEAKGGNKEQVGAVEIIYRAELVEGEMTALNMTHHWAFNLEFSDMGRDGPCPVGDVKNHTLHFKSKDILDLAEDTALPTGKTVPAPKSRDFSTPKKIGQDFPEGGLDDYWIFERGSGEREVLDGGVEGSDVFADIEKDKEIVAVLSSDKNNISLNFTTNQPGVQAWSGTGGYDGQDSRRKIHGGKAVENQDDGYKVPPAFAMEFHSVYDAWMHPELKKLGWDTVLKKGQVYNNWVRMTIKSE
ncbi:hypothetical protein FFLO_04972 [Filobasidium floriforme]|uniref:Aldose 1-epimerase n=1 Tax=Filobasidium floriforme TaxID=5210 RepID=A0A8K0JNB0_9TREE|nr:galactose mutarotase-like domain-containing protein [Filobasidium floriforme]KAG7530546.1 hypothetical protein FFLO_04972 [Filobasidium floriforme]KAH8080093.1 galactose mutarotase-like domain-containing protein [Filobasidium floriforme]